MHVTIVGDDRRYVAQLQIERRGKRKFGWESEEWKPRCGDLFGLVRQVHRPRARVILCSCPSRNQHIQSSCKRCYRCYLAKGDPTVLIFRVFQHAVKGPKLFPLLIFHNEVLHSTVTFEPQGIIDGGRPFLMRTEVKSFRENGDIDLNLAGCPYSDFVHQTLGLMWTFPEPSFTIQFASPKTLQCASLDFEC